MDTPEPNTKLAVTVRTARETKGLSIRGLASRMGITPSYIHKLESGVFGSISPEKIQALAGVLELDPQDLFTVAGYQVPKGLPSFEPYLRTRYGDDLPEEAIQHMSEYFEYERAKYGGGNRRPIGDEDEAEEDSDHGARS